MITASGLIQLGFKPEIDFRVEDHGSGAVIAEWKSASPQPSEAEIEAADVEYQTAWNAQEYARNRATAYASTGDQLDMQYWDSVNDTTTWKDHIASVKAQFPKV
jgi:hypothetical protein